MPRGRSLPRMRPQPNSGVPRRQQASPKRQVYAGSLDRKATPRDMQISMDPALLAKTPVLCNRYVVDGVEPDNLPARHDGRLPGRRAQSAPRTQNYLAPPKPISRQPSREDLESVRGSSRRKRPSPARKFFLNF